MAQVKIQQAYGFKGYVDVFPVPVLAQEAPSTSDTNYPIGQTWIDEANDAVYVLTSVVNNSATWSTSPASGATTLASLEVTGASDLQGNVTVGGTLDVTGATTVVDLSVSGSFNLSGMAGQLDFTTTAAQADAIVLSAPNGGIDLTSGGAFDMDLTSAGGINIVSNENAIGAVTIEADGGTSETVYIHSDQGTSASSIDIASDAGGIRVTSGLDNANSIYLRANAGTSETIKIHADQGTGNGSLELTSDGGGIDVNAVKRVTIDTTGAAGEDIALTNTSGSIVLSAGESANDAIKIESTAGGLQLLASGAAAGEDIVLTATGSSVRITSTENVADSIVLSSTNGGIDITTNSTEDLDISGSGGVNIVSTENAAAAVTIEADGGTSETVFIHSDQGTGADSINVVSDVGGITLNGGLAGDAITFTAASGSVNLTAGEAVADAVVINASDAAGGIQIQAGSNGILIGNQADCAVIDIGDVVPTSARTITVGGGAVATAIADTIDIAPDGATTDAGASKVLNLNTGALDTATLTTNIASGNVASGTHTVNVSTGTGTKTVNVGNADANTTVNVDGVLAVNNNINANVTINDGTSTGTVTVGSANAGAIAVDSGAGISLDAAAASNFSISGAGDLTLAASTSSVAITGAEAANDAVLVSATNAAGGVTLDVGTIAGSSQQVTLTDGTSTARIQIGSGVPSHTAAQGSLYINVAGSTSTTILYANSDGSTTWVGVGS